MPDYLGGKMERPAATPLPFNSRICSTADLARAPQGHRWLLGKFLRMGLEILIEFEFAKEEGRHYRTDIYLPELCVAVEVDGFWACGQRRMPSAHLQPKGRRKDMMRDAYALGTFGIKVLRCGTDKETQAAVLDAVKDLNNRK